MTFSIIYNLAQYLYHTLHLIVDQHSILSITLLHISIDYIYIVIMVLLILNPNKYTTIKDNEK